MTTQGRLSRRALSTAWGAIAILFIWMAGEAGAATIDFGLTGSGNQQANIGFAGGYNPLQGSNISVNDVFGNGTLLNNGSHAAIQNAHLNFNTGNLITSNGTTFSFGSKDGNNNLISYFEIVGDYDNKTNVSLLKGVINSLTVSMDNAHSNATISNAAMTVTENALSSYYGFQAGTQFGGVMNLSFAVLQPGFTGEVSGGNISASPVPLPAAAWLFGPTVAGMLGFRRRLFSVHA